MAQATGVVRIGTSGWRYKHWRGRFYPPKLTQRRELEFAAGHFGSIELNGTFYSLQRPESFQEWVRATPEEFVFAVKGPRFITHMLKLRNARQALANFFANGFLDLGSKAGPVLWQFPPQLRYSEERFAEFFRQLPRTHAAAAKLAREHDARLDDRATTKVKRGCAKLPVRHAVEIRHDSFASPEFIALLRQHDIALVVADTVAWPLLVDVTADFVYCRLHGSEKLYVSGYEHDALEIWADRIAAWAIGGRAEGPYVSDQPVDVRPRDVYVYFDNDAEVRAPFDATELMKKVKARLRAGAIPDELSS